MIIRAVKKQGRDQPTSEEPGELIWTCSTQEMGVDSDPLEASLLGLSGMSIEIGHWISLCDFAESLESWSPDISTQVPVEVLISTYPKCKTLAFFVDQSVAAEKFLKTTSEFLSAAFVQSEVWIRVE